MAVTVSFQNPKTGEIKPVKTGWSWILFFFSSFFGLPLFLRKLPTFGAVFLAVAVMNLLLPEMARDEDSRTGAQILMTILIFGLDVWIAIKGNEITAKNYLDMGWEIMNPDSPEVAIARQTWKLPKPIEVQSKLANG